jgi:hypothetical protein
MMPPSWRDAPRLSQTNSPTKTSSGRNPPTTLRRLVEAPVPFTVTPCCSRSAASVLSFSAVGMRDSYCVRALSSSRPVTLPPGSIVALFTWLASTLAFQPVNDSDLVFGELEVGANSSSRVTSSPTIQSPCSQRGVG